MRRFFGHIDLRVRILIEAKSLYDVLLPALGLHAWAKIEGWVQYEAAGTNGVPECVGLTDRRDRLPMNVGLLFWQITRSRLIDWPRSRSGPAREMWKAAVRGAALLCSLFEDPSGNRLEICNREPAESSPADS